jgi:hypothetical protein
MEQLREAKLRSADNGQSSRSGFHREAQGYRFSPPFDVMHIPFRLRNVRIYIDVSITQLLLQL